MTHQPLQLGAVLDIARPTKLQAAARNLAAIAGLARMAAENAPAQGRIALAAFRWDAASLIECRISVAANKGFFGSAFIMVLDGETAAHRRAQ